MSVMKILTGLRNHWKKSVFAAGVSTYAISYSREKYEIHQLMRGYCEEAAKFGDSPIKSIISPKRVIVILNPAANKKSAEKTFEKYCAPILYLGGFLVDIVRTEAEGHATRYVEELEKLPDAIIVAGGDGTASETVTGLLRRTNRDKCPVGILPLGRTNSVAEKFHKFSLETSNLDEVRGLADSAFAVLRGKTEKKNVMKIQPLDTNEDESPVKPIFALGSLHWGAFRDALSLRDKYWYLGPFKEYASTLFNAFSNKLTWNCQAKVVYTPPCSGCSNCFINEEVKPLVSNRWWARFIPRFKLGQQSQNITDYSKIINENCSKQSEVEISPTEIILSIEDDLEKIPKLMVKVEDPIQSSFDFISKSWSRLKTKNSELKDEVEGRTIELIPKTVVAEDNRELFYSIDSEAYEVRPIKISIIPRAIDFYVL